MKRSTLALAVVCTCLLLAPLAGPVLAEDIFPRPAELEPDVRFWTRIYAEVGTNGGLIHDSRDLGIVYEVIRLPEGSSARGRERFTESIKKGYKEILRSLARGRRSGLSVREQRVLALFPNGVSNGTLRAASSRIRFQLGQADKFRAGLIRSGAWEPHIRQTFTAMGLPVQLASLPHVESSYTPHAYSRVGAAGLWQFTRSTGRRFMRVDHVVDERLDPYTSTVAAARLLEQNRRVTGSWPLAITAYNHGASGMRRAVRKLGTSDIATIVRNYQSRTFGFASRNFYVEFLAAVDVDFNSEKHFGPLLMDAPVEYESAELEFYATPETVAHAVGIDLASLKASNPALRPSVWQGAKYLPRGYELRVPRDRLARPLATTLAAVAARERIAAQRRDTYHIVRRGETLSGIAARYRSTVSELMALNGLRSRNRIRSGQKLRLPIDGPPSQIASRPVRVTSPPKDGLHTVRRGDTLARIAARYGLSERDLVANNRLRNRNRIYVGQTLRLTPDAPAPKEAVELTLASAAPLKRAPRPEVASRTRTTAQSDKDGERDRDKDTAGPAPSSDPHPETSVTFSQPPSVHEIAAVSTPPMRTLTQEAQIAAEVEAQAEATNEVRTGLVADPNDYSVAANDTIEVHAAETLGHYAEWLGIRASRLRQLNKLRYRDPLVIGSHLRLDFSRVTRDEFEAKRLEYHRDLQEDFFERFEIAGTRIHVMRRGDSLWSLAERKYRVPIWLLRQYNPDLGFEGLPAGTRVTIPQIEPHTDV